MKSAAYRSGFDDGESRLRDAEILGEQTDRASVEAWFAPGQETPDTALINALGMTGTAEALKVNCTEGRLWNEALAEYNAGFRDGSLSGAT